MFGNKKDKKNEKINDILDLMKEQREGFEASVDELEDYRKAIWGDFSQVAKNTDEVCDYIQMNLEEEASTIHNIDSCALDFSQVYNEYRQLEVQVQEQIQAIVDLVESNKHFTSPAKQLSEVSKSIGVSVQTYENQLNASNENSIEVTREDLIAWKEKAAELEDTSNRLIALMKDSNVGISKLLMKMQEIKGFMEESGMRDFSKDLTLVRDQVIKTRNLDEEILKSCQRNQIQLNDIQEDMQNQKKKLTEMESDLFYILDSAEEQIRGTHRR